ncbi:MULTISPECIES: DNA circularization N-terminal domain-containing protein [unclassified Acinetobacter]|uniref:DNA circularization N-terminal domain-containing protein n=1 Tax=unclassified Acinetobacter TaxID=196816 RepID=UPI00190A7FA0|nr:MULTISPECIES: DNA circularization N-terminal domain-containing protein [unclassified Acinetobacter]MBK0062379.1 DNA circularization N-terminal domain-containing protein [Acinetobacter sp. S55]MBK0066183.1 DNA circularization N-terminal domain-containing protein [Acinetobacter sp. S54]
MGWETDLYEGSFRGVTFDTVSITDAYTKSLAIHQAPYSNAAQIEDMGLDPRKISVTALYTGDYYLPWLKALTAALVETGSGELIHPIHGIAQVYAHSWQEVHDAENPDYVGLSIDFLKAEDEERSLFIPTSTVESIDYEQILATPAQSLEKELKALERSDSNAFFNTVSKIRNGLQSAYKLINNTQKNIDNVLSPASWAYGLVSDVSKLVTFDVTDISAMSKWRSLAKRVEKLGAVFDDNNSSPALKQLWRATTVTSQVAVAQQIVNLTREETAKANSTEASLTPPELAVIRQRVRQDLQSTIVQERSISAEIADSNNLQPVTQIAVYKQAADQIHEQIQELIEARPPITTTVIKLPSTVHLLAHQLYGDFTRSSEILRLNPNLENPAVLRAGQELTVYAR